MPAATFRGLVVLAFGLLLAACGTAPKPGQPTASGLTAASILALPSETPARRRTATAVRLPTATPEPPAADETPLAEEPLPAVAVPGTPLPTPTPSLPGPTLNPNLVLRLTPTEPPTPDPELGVGETTYEDEFEGEAGWYWSYPENEVAAFSLGGQRLNAVMKVGLAGGGRLVAGPPGMWVGDQQLQVTALTNLCYAKDEYGVLFRANAAATDGYLFKLNCEGKARAEVLKNLKPAVLADWTASPAIAPGAPAENTLLVWAGGSQLHFFVNGRHLFSAVDQTFTNGTYGFYIYDRTSGGASVSFDDLVVRSVVTP
jgi:hypothetical protein